MSGILGVPVVGASARSGKGLEELKDAIEKVADGRIRTSPFRIRYDDVIEKPTGKIEPETEDMDAIVSDLVTASEKNRTGNRHFGGNSRQQTRA